MGRYNWSSRHTVENCRVISIIKLKEWGYFKGVSEIEVDSNYGSGGIKWTNSSGEETGNIGISMNININKGELYLRYTWTSNATGEKEEFNYPVTLIPSSCHFGGRRWWFICPLTTNGVYCGKRVGRLYLPPNGKYFGCRYCYNLTYQSCKEHDKRIDALSKNPELFLASLKSKNPMRSLLAIKAGLKYLK